MSILPPGMDRSYNGTYGKDSALQDWQRNAERTLERTVDPTQRSRPAIQGTIRAVTPEPVDHGLNDSYGIGSSTLTTVSLIFVLIFFLLCDLGS
jgi:hypothetical protein